MKKGEILEAVVTKYDFPNKGSFTLEDRVVTVKGAFPGEKIRFQVSKMRSGRAEGRLLEVLERGPLEDVSPACPHFGVCGGCTYQTMSYENQLTLKGNLVKGLIDEVATSAYEWEGIKSSPVTEGYRNKMEYSFGDEYKDGPLALGMHKKGSFYDIVSTTDCTIVHPDYNTIMKCILDFYTEKNVPYYKKMAREGVLRHLVLRRSVSTKDLMINLVVTSQNRESLCVEELKERLLALSLEGQIASFLLTINDNLADAVVSDETIVVYGEEFIKEQLLGLNFKISPFSFFQPNSYSAQVLYKTAQEYVGETKDKVIFDLYSGTGTIAQVMAPVAKKVIGVEIVEEAVEAAKMNAALNGLANCDFIAGDVLKVIDEIKDKPDMIILDPPRDGIHPKAIQKIIDFGVDSMVYISCKPTSLARDLITLQASGYKIVKACAVDQFVNTVHVETVVLLSKKHINPNDYVEIGVDAEAYYKIKGDKH